jgi:hypothetical protein
MLTSQVPNISFTFPVAQLAYGTILLAMKNHFMKRTKLAAQPPLLSRASLPRPGRPRRLALCLRALISEIQEQVATKKRSAVEVTVEYIQRVQRIEPSLHSFITVDEANALKQVCLFRARLFAGILHKPQSCIDCNASLEWEYEKCSC